VRTGALAISDRRELRRVLAEARMDAAGLITGVDRSPSIRPGKTAEEVGALVESWIETEMSVSRRIATSGPYVPAARSGPVPTPQA